VGIRANIENLEWAQWLDQVYARHDFDMSIVGHAEPMDYDIYARDDYYFGYQTRISKRSSRRWKTPWIRRSARNYCGVCNTSWPTMRSTDTCSSIQTLRLGCASRGPGVRQCTERGRLKNARYSRASSAPRDRASAAAGTQSFRLMPWLAAAAALILSAFAVRRFGMAFLGRRLAVLTGTAIAATAVVFVIVQVIPGDPVRYMMGLQADSAAMSALRHQLGLDVAPLWRYFIWSEDSSMATSVRATRIASRWED